MRASVSKREEYLEVDLVAALCIRFNTLDMYEVDVFEAEKCLRGPHDLARQFVVRVKTLARVVQVVRRRLCLAIVSPASRDSASKDTALGNVMLAGLASEVCNAIVALTLDGLDNRAATLVSANGLGYRSDVRAKRVYNATCLPLSILLREAEGIKMKGGGLVFVEDGVFLDLLVVGDNGTVLCIHPVGALGGLHSKHGRNASKVLEDATRNVRVCIFGDAASDAATGRAVDVDFATVLGVEEAKGGKILDGITTGLDIRGGVDGATVAGDDISRGDIAPTGNGGRSTQTLVRIMEGIAWD